MLRAPGLSCGTGRARGAHLDSLLTWAGGGKVTAQGEAQPPRPGPAAWGPAVRDAPRPGSLRDGLLPVEGWGSSHFIQ